MATFSEENYLKTIYHLGRRGRHSVSTNAIADKIDTKPSSVTDMLRKLSEKDLVHYVKYQGVSLTHEGRKMAALVVRRHRLWEAFLVDKLDFRWDEIHDVAEQLEHIRSEKLIAQLDAFLGYPSHDPHGDPIPDEEGNIKKSQKIHLSQVNKQVQCTCNGVKDSSSEFLRYLDKNRIGIGTVFQVVSKELFDGSMIVKIDELELTISKEVANNIYVKIN